MEQFQTLSGKNTSIPCTGGQAACRRCHHSFRVVHRGQVFCSRGCAQKGCTQEKKVPDHLIEAASYRVLGKVSTWVAEGRALGVSDNAVRKRAKRMGLLGA